MYSIVSRREGGRSLSNRKKHYRSNTPENKIRYDVVSFLLLLLFIFTTKLKPSIIIINI